MTEKVERKGVPIHYYDYLKPRLWGFYSITQNQILEYCLPVNLKLLETVSLSKKHIFPDKWFKVILARNSGTSRWHFTKNGSTV